MKGLVFKWQAADTASVSDSRGPAGPGMIALWQAQLGRILSDHPDVRGVIVYPPTIDWDIDLFQRPQQLLRAFSGLGYLALYCGKRARVSDPVGFRRLADNLYLCSASMEVFAHLRGPVVWISRGDLRRHLGFFDHPYVVYDYIDDLAIFDSYGEPMYQGHRHLVKTADLCVATATKLFEEMKAQRPDALLCPNGADYPFFSSARDRSCLPAPSDLRQLVETGRPIVGYHGALARWFDYELLWRVSRARPQWQFVLIGPDYDSSLLPSGVTALPNVYWLGSRAYSTLNAYLAYFDVAMIPFKLNQITASTSPIKLFEYMAAGKPVVSTALPECARYPVVLVAKGQEAFVAQLGQALHLRDDPGYLRLLDRTARENSWERRAKQVIAALESASCGTQGKGGSRQPG